MKKLIVLFAIVMALACLVGCTETVGKAVEVKSIALTSETYAYAIAKENTELLTAANAFLAEIEADGTLAEVINGFFDGTTDFAYENPDSKEGCLVMATNAYFPPFEYYTGNKFTGVDVKIASLLAEYLGKQLYVADMKFDSIIASVKSGESDIGMAGMTVTQTRLEQVSFTTGYYESAQVLVVLDSDTEFDNCTTADEVEAILKAKTSAYCVGTQSGTTGYMYSAGDEDFGYGGFTNLTTKAYSNGALAIQDLSNGRINAVIIDKQPALMISASVNAKLGK
ncbi:MAG: transporter substrate-binding domain-containing protein [Clostridia bacterium]|nr:transporter substrate-binding domain-containing protein [Clostridia bacterium]